MIGFFGDSWIDIHGNIDEEYWPVLTAKKCNLTPAYLGASGSSHYNAYKKFLKNYEKFKVIVFSHTAYTRYPCLPEEEEKKHLHWNTGQFGSRNATSEFFDKVTPYYPDLFPDDLLTFLCGNIYSDINNICLKNNIYLINVFPYDVKYTTASEFPIIKGLQNVSGREIIKIDGKEYNTQKWLSKSWEGIDFRMCHFNFSNHEMFSNLLSNIIKEKPYNKTYNLLKYPYSIRDKKTDMLLEKLLVDKQ